ncbi:MAG TPA: dihydrodipicolinate synthase family protein [Syntrophales bacterium]|nr:dihydrodipicolinate synthase family protein [Syntrophales bacterium]
MKMEGVYPAMATPLTADEKIDKPSLRKLVSYLMEGGVYGIVALGSTGEFPAMTEAMRQEVTETVLAEVNGRVPVVIGCGEPGTRRTIEQVKAASKTRAKGVLVALPYYFPLDQSGVIRHYEMVADASTLPVIAYNFPQMTKIAIAPDTLARLSSHENIIGVKDSSGDFFGLQRYLEVTTGADFAVMCGNPALGLAAYQSGAKGGIYAGCSLFPKQCVDCYVAYKNGDMTAAVALQKKLSLIPLMSGFGPNAAVIKFGLSKLGVCGSSVTAPFRLPDGQEEKIVNWMRSIGITIPS